MTKGSSQLFAGRVEPRRACPPFSTPVWDLLAGLISGCMGLADEICRGQDPIAVHGRLGPFIPLQDGAFRIRHSSVGAFR
jgi:hypothetical protein